MKRNNRLPIFAVWFGVILMTLVACGSQSKLQPGAEATVTVREIVNRVEFNSLRSQSVNPNIFIDLSLGQRLQTGNLVKTHKNSSARIDISIDRFTRISRTIPETIWQLGRFTSNGEMIIELHEGKIFVFDEDNGKENWPLHIVTPAGTASARGTWMAVEFDPVTGIIQVECLRGICELENEFGYQVFTNEHVVISTAESVPTDPKPMNENQIEAFEALPEVVADELPIPVQFSQVEVIAILNVAKAAAMERKALREENRTNSAQSSDDGSGPGNNFPIAAVNSAANGSDSRQGSRDTGIAASTKPNPGRSGDDSQNRARDDDAPGKNKPDGGNASNSGNPFDNPNKVQGESNKDFGQSGGNGVIRARNDDAPGADKPNGGSDSNSGKSSDASAKKPSFGGQGGISSLTERLRKLGFIDHEAVRLEQQGQAEKIIEAIDAAVANGAGNAPVVVTKVKGPGNGGAANDNAGGGGIDTPSSNANPLAGGIWAGFDLSDNPRVPDVAKQNKDNAGDNGKANANSDGSGNANVNANSDGSGNANSDGSGNANSGGDTNDNANPGCNGDDNASSGCNVNDNATAGGDGKGKGNGKP